MIKSFADDGFIRHGVFRLGAGQQFKYVSGDGKPCGATYRDRAGAGERGDAAGYRSLAVNLSPM